MEIWVSLIIVSILITVRYTRSYVRVRRLIKPTDFEEVYHSLRCQLSWLYLNTPWDPDNPDQDCFDLPDEVSFYKESRRALKCTLDYNHTGRTASYEANYMLLRHYRNLQEKHHV